MSSKKHPRVLSRREFLRNTAWRHPPSLSYPGMSSGRGFVAPSDKLQIAAIGAGGKGADDIRHFFASGKADIAYLCDVDDRQAAASMKQFDKAKYYKDFREMLDKEHKHIDAVSVSIPDNCHAVAAMAAIMLGKHVYVQKPMTHDIYEARMLTEAVKRYKVVAQMGNQGASRRWRPPHAGMVQCRVDRRCHGNPCLDQPACMAARRSGTPRAPTRSRRS